MKLGSRLILTARCVRCVTANEFCSNTFIMSAKSDGIMLQTASAPATPFNVRVNSCTANAVQVAWSPLDDSSVEVLGAYVSNSLRQSATESHKPDVKCG